MKYSDVLSVIESSSLLDLYRFQSEISLMLSDPRRISEVKAKLKTGMQVSYFCHKSNKLHPAVIEEVCRTGVKLIDKSDGQRWNVPIGAIDPTATHYDESQFVDSGITSSHDKGSFELTLNGSCKHALHSELKNLFTLTITQDSIPDQLIDNLPPLIKKEYLAIELGAYKRDVKFIPKITRFLAKHPHIPKLYNFLASLYSLDGQDTQSYEVMNKLYSKFPDYLFAKIGYAKFCLNKGNFVEFDKIFQGKHGLKLLYPERNEFHISEFIGFIDVMHEHACYTGKLDLAKKILETLKGISLVNKDLIRILGKRQNRFEKMNIIDPKEIMALLNQMSKK